jgi:hypothetical protein
MSEALENLKEKLGEYTNIAEFIAAHPLAALILVAVCLIAVLAIIIGVALLYARYLPLLFGAVTVIAIFYILDVKMDVDIPDWAWIVAPLAVGLFFFSVNLTSLLIVPYDVTQPATSTSNLAASFLIAFTASLLAASIVAYAAEH